MIRITTTDDHNRTLMVDGVELTGFNGGRSDHMKIRVNYVSGYPADEFGDGALAVELDGKIIPAILSASVDRELLLERLGELTEYADRVLGDICDEDTGWYYQFQARIQQAYAALRGQEQRAAGSSEKPVPLPDQIVARIEAFDRECSEAEHTDTGEAWDLLHWIKNRLGGDA